MCLSKSKIAGGKVGSPIIQNPRKIPSGRKRTKPGTACIMLGTHTQNKNKVISVFFGSVPVGSLFNFRSRARNVKLLFIYFYF